MYRDHAPGSKVYNETPLSGIVSKDPGSFRDSNRKGHQIFRVQFIGTGFGLGKRRAMEEIHALVNTLILVINC